MNVYRGNLNAVTLRIAIICSEVNADLVQKLLDASLETLKAHGCKHNNITIIWVAGAYEIPLLAKRLAKAKNQHALITLGVVIDGETHHASLINTDVSKSLQTISQKYDIPIAHGILSVRNRQQAIDRTESKKGNRGIAVTLAAIKTATLLESL